MTPPPAQSHLEMLAETLGNMRDSWVLISIALKDHVASAASAECDEVRLQVEQYLAGIKAGDKGMR